MIVKTLMIVFVSSVLVMLVLKFPLHFERCLFLLLKFPQLVVN